LRQAVANPLNLFQVLKTVEHIAFALPTYTVYSYMQKCCVLSGWS